MKRVISLVLAVLLLCTMIPTVALTADATSVSQAQAVAWTQNKIGVGLDYDGIYGNQCVDLIYYYYAYLGVSPAGGHAYEYISNTLPAGWTRISSNIVPQPGDIAVWKVNYPGWTYEYGHISIVLSGNSSTFNTVHQNFAGNSVCVQTNNLSNDLLACVIRPNFGGGTSQISYSSITADDYYLKHNSTGKYLAVDGGIDADQQNISVAAFTGGGEMKLAISAASQGYIMRPHCAVRIVNPYGFSVTSGLNVSLWPDVNDITQWWGFEKVSGGYIIHNMQNESCVLAVSGTNVVTATYTGAADQVWSLEPVACSHSYSSSVTTAATCTSSGVRTYTCTKCGDSYTEAIAATGHSYTSAVTAPTCTAQGYTTHTCSKCGRSYKDSYTSTAEHSYISVVTAPSCTALGYTTHTCSKCGDSYQDSYTDITEHNYVDYFCTACGKVAPPKDGFTSERFDGGVLTISGTGAIRQSFVDSWQNSATKLVIKNGVTHIDETAFQNFTNLTSVTLPSSLVFIGEGAFSNCNNLTTVLYCGTEQQWNRIVVGADNTSLTNAARQNHDWKEATCAVPKICAGCGITEGETLEHTYENGICTFCGAAHPDYKPADSIVWSLSEDGVLSIYGTGDMKDEPFIESAEIREAVKRVVIENGVTSIGSSAFSHCSSLTSVTIPDSVTSIGNYAFNYCSSLTSVVIPDSVTGIGDNAFGNCGSLTSVTIPDSVTSIGSHAFWYCSSLTSVTIGNSVTSIGYSAFDGCSSLTYNTYDNAKYLGNANNPYIILVKADSTFITSCVIHEDTKFVYDDAFYKCSSLTSVTVPDSVTSIGDSAFSGCSSLTNVTIGDSVTSIGGRAFWDCSSLTSVNIPDSVTSVGGYAFDGCSGLTSVNITDIAAWCGIYFNFSAANPLLYAQNLYLNGELVTDLVIPDDVTSINHFAFNCCSSLTSVVIPDSVTSIGMFAFSGCDSLTTVSLPNSLTSIGDYAFRNCSSLIGVTIPDSVTSIGDYAFGDCSSLASVVIPDSVTSIGHAAFSGLWQPDF